MMLGIMSLLHVRERSKISQKSRLRRQVATGRLATIAPHLTWLFLVATNLDNLIIRNG
jgi:hypothetical protein